MLPFETDPDFISNESIPVEILVDFPAKRQDERACPRLHVRGKIMIILTGHLLSAQENQCLSFPFFGFPCLKANRGGQ